MIKEAIILCGGLGTRLQDEVPDLPKPMAPVRNKPFLEYILKKYSQFGIEKVILAVGYKHEVIGNYFGNSFHSTNIEYTIEEELLGTGGAIKQALEHARSPLILIQNGDTFFDIDLNKFLNFHNQKKSNLTLALYPTDDISRYGSVVVDDNNRITGFAEKGSGKGQGYINGGIYLLNKEYFMDFDLPGKFSFEKNFLEENYKSENFYGEICYSYFLDIGIPEDYKLAQDELEGLPNK